MVEIREESENINYPRGLHVVHGPRVLRVWCTMIGLFPNFPLSSEPKVAIQWLAFLLRVREVLGSNLGTDTDYRYCFRGFPQSLQICRDGTLH
jgi:hypothetical protein